MTNPLFEQELTEQEAARYVAGIYASLEQIDSAIASDSTADEMLPVLAKNTQFILLALSNAAIRQGIEDIPAIHQSIREAQQAHQMKLAQERAAREALPKPNPLLAHLEELGL